ncbi:hypothetical protein E2562_018641 [Oryza meyeriana var. granulata]|uniref:Uncharacterized protein n=1 Tax=Oryza meyeriana var. granulata TaxID=110450 RepID=A0A6G1BXI8_9ORYZ|nr:hypothetical protein E2562_018641 [Oryza meyeriana var. granulata]
MSRARTLLELEQAIAGEQALGTLCSTSISCRPALELALNLRRHHHGLELALSSSTLDLRWHRLALEFTIFGEQSSVTALNLCRTSPCA